MLQVRLDGHNKTKHFLCSSILQGAVGPRGDPGPAGSPGPPVSAFNDPYNDFLSATVVLFYLFFSLSSLAHLSVPPPGSPCNNS